MKTMLRICIETPDSGAVYEDGGHGEQLIQEEEKAYWEDWHTALVAAITPPIDSEKLADEMEQKLEEYYSEDGELPESKITITSEKQ